MTFEDGAHKVRGGRIVKSREEGEGIFVGFRHYGIIGDISYCATIIFTFQRFCYMANKNWTFFEKYIFFHKGGEVNGQRTK